MEYLNSVTLILLLTLFIDNSHLLPVTDNFRTVTSIYDTAQIGIVSETTPPLLFPSDPNQFLIKPPNENEIKRLEHIVNNDEISMKDQIQTTAINRVNTPEGAKLFRVENLNDAPEIFPTEEQLPLKDQVENIQEDDTSHSENGLEENFRTPKLAFQREKEIFEEDIEVNSIQMNHGHTAAMFAAIIAILCIVVYFGLYSWRSYVNKRYGMRSRLVTDEDFYNNDDTITPNNILN